MPKTIYLSELGAKFEGADDTEAQLKAISILSANNGGVIVFDGSGASRCLAPWPTINKYKTPITIIGFGKKVTNIQFEAFKDTPCISFDSSRRDVEGLTIKDIGIRHTGSATIFESTTGRFKDCLLENVYFGQTTDSNKTTVKITGGLQSILRGVTINGGHSGAIGLDFAGTHCQLEKIFAPDKGTSPSNFIKARMVNGSILNCRTEGGNGDFDYNFTDSDHLECNLFTEGHLSKTSVLIENSNEIYLSGSLGTQIGEEPLGVSFIHSSHCVIDKLKMSSRYKNIVFDKASYSNTIKGLRVIKTNFCTEKNDVFDDGFDNKYELTCTTNVTGGERIYKMVN